MNLILAYDSETQTLPMWHEPSEDPRQPHIVQLAACLFDADTRHTIASFDVVVQPDGWTIPDDVAAIHGVTTERALEVGVPERLAVRMLLALHKVARARLAHNESFDARIVRIALMRYASAEVADEWKAAPAHCTQLLSTPILKIPPTPKMVAARRMHYKSANLREAYRFFTGKDLENAHSAMADVQGCLAVWWGIQDRQCEVVAP